MRPTSISTILTNVSGLSTDGNFFGQSVAISDGIALIGATGDDANGSGSGSGYLFDLQASPADLDCNGTVGVSDLLVLLAS